ncbi:hypothetical protein MBBA_2151 [Methanoculleus bourgensis]|nr:hypothetical protein MBBA_2151 [Methanoculleus bourgensis]
MPYPLQPGACLFQGIQATGPGITKRLLDSPDSLVAQGFVVFDNHIMRQTPTSGINVTKFAQKR